MEQPAKTLAIERIDQWFLDINILSFSIEGWSKDNIWTVSIGKPNKAEYSVESESDWDFQYAKRVAEAVLG